MYIDDGGLINIAEALIRSTRKEFVDGVYAIYAKHHCVPQEEIEKLPTYRFVMRDVYGIFNMYETDSKGVIDQWVRLGILKYYEYAYMRTAEKLYFSRFPEETTKRNRKSLKELLTSDRGLDEDFITARNYIESHFGEDHLKELDRMAIYRAVKKISKLVKNTATNIEGGSYHEQSL